MMHVIIASLPLASALCALPTKAAGRMSVQLAKKTPDELASVAWLQLDTFDPKPAKAPSFFDQLLGGGSFAGSTRADRAARLADELADRLDAGSDLFVLRDNEDDSTLIATADLSEQEMQLPTHSLTEGLYLSSMAVDVAERRRGHGRALLLAAEGRAAERGAECIWLHVERTNVGAIALYESSGFKRQPESRRLDAFTLALDLGQKEPLLFCKSIPAVIADMAVEEDKEQRPVASGQSVSTSGSVSPRS